jgi:hypothetical protein
MAIGFLPQQGGMTGGYGMPRMPEYGQAPEQTPGMMQPMQPKPKKRGLFGNKRNIVGLIGDTLSIMGGGAPTFVPGQLQARQQAQEMQRAAAMEAEKRAAEMQDFVSRETWKRSNPEPRYNDTAADLEWYKGLSPEDRALHHEMNPEFRQGPDGNFYRINTQQGPMPTFTMDDWDKAGGPTQPASGNFP